MSLTSTSRLLRGDSPSCWSPVRAHYHRGLGADTDLVRPSNTALLSIKIQRMGLSPATPPSFTFLTSLWTPRVCTFIGGGGQVDEVFGIIYPVVSLAEAPTCPRLHPHLGSSGPVKHKHRLSWIWEGNERRGDFWWTHRSQHSEYVVSPLTFADDWRRCSKRCVLRKPQGFPWVFCLRSLRSAWLTPKPSESARAMEALMLFFRQYIVTEALLTETRAFCLHKSSKTANSTRTDWSFETCFPLRKATLAAS